VVSHDRAFLERTVADVVVLDGSGTVARRPGGYGAWEAERRALRSQPRAGSGRRDGARTAVPRSAGSATSGPRADPEPAAARSASTVRQLIRQTEKDLARLERRRDRLTEQVESARADHQELARLGAELAAIGAEIEAVEHHWLELSTEAESATR